MEFYVFKKTEEESEDFPSDEEEEDEEDEDCSDDDSNDEDVHPAYVLSESDE